MRSVDDLTTSARIRDAAIDQFGRHGFGVGVRAIATAAGVSPGLVIHHFGSKDGLRKACDDHIAEVVRESKSESLRNADPAAWFAAVAEIEEFAPMMAYLVRSMQNGGDLATVLWRRMIDNAEQYMDDGVRAGTIKPSRDPKARARFLALTGGGAFLLYIQLHETPTDLRAVLHDYANDMVLPALEVYTQGLLTDSTMYDAFVDRQEHGIAITTPPGETDDVTSR
jgi:AcrR family transcriptional regulator